MTIKDISPPGTGHNQQKRRDEIAMLPPVERDPDSSLILDQREACAALGTPYKNSQGLTEGRIMKKIKSHALIGPAKSPQTERD